MNLQLIIDYERTINNPKQSMNPNFRIVHGFCAIEINNERQIVNQSKILSNYQECLNHVVANLQEIFTYACEAGHSMIAQMVVPIIKNRQHRSTSTRGGVQNGMLQWS